jgi:cob(I)alamin adenosyltransferase
MIAGEIMAITTKTGDKGFTGLYLGGRVPKDHPRVESCGALDELCSYLGLCKSLIKDKDKIKIIETIQRDLFIAGAEIAVKPVHITRLKNRIDNSFVKRLEKEIIVLEKKIKLKKYCFLLPGENLICATFDIARTIARKAERRIAALLHKGQIKNSNLIIYFNRLSDLLYLLARFYEKRQHKLTPAR